MDGSNVRRVSITPTTYDNEVDWGTQPLVG
jgi:hypothetical protein